MKAILQKPNFLLLMVLMAGQVMAAANPVITVRNGYVRGLPSSAANTAVYMTIINNGDTDVVLTGATTPAATSASLHNTVSRGGVMTMEQLESLVVPARGRLELKSGGTHLMLMGLKKSLKSGDEVVLTLQFEGAFTASIRLPVVSVLDERANGGE